MKPTIAALLTIWLFSCDSLSRKHNEDIAPAVSKEMVDVAHNSEPEIVRIIVKHISFNIFTYADIDCEAFDTMFSAETIEIQDKARLRTINDRINALSLAQDAGPHGVDTRAKATIFYNDNTKLSFCLDKFHIEIKGKTYENDSTLRTSLGLKNYKIYK